MGSLSLLSTNEKLIGRNCSGCGLEKRKYSRKDPLRWPRDTLYPQKLVLTSPKTGDRSVGIVRKGDMYYRLSPLNEYQCFLWSRFHKLVRLEIFIEFYFNWQNLYYMLTGLVELFYF
jgi:hypothetical protein